jgi:hypothetical protein
MADIFISYSKKDRNLAKQLADFLQGQLSLTVWWDTSLVAGDQFRDEIKRQLGLSKAVLVVWTVNSIDSKWVQDEADEALRCQKYIPLYNETINPGNDIPLGLRSAQALFVKNEEKVADALSHLITKTNIEKLRAPQLSSKYLIWFTVLSVTLSIIVMVAMHFWPKYVMFIIWAVAIILTSHMIWPRTLNLMKKSHLEPTFSLKRIMLHQRYMEVAFPILIFFLIIIIFPRAVSQWSDGVIIPNVTRQHPPQSESETMTTYQHTTKIITGLILLATPVVFVKGLIAVRKACRADFWNSVEYRVGEEKFNIPSQLGGRYQHLNSELKYTYLSLFYPLILMCFLYLSNAPAKLENITTLWMMSSFSVSALFICFHYKMKDALYL